MYLPVGKAFRRPGGHQGTANTALVFHGRPDKGSPNG